MKRRIFSIILALVMVLGVLPAMSAPVEATTAQINAFLSDPRWAHGASYGVGQTPKLGPYGNFSECAAYCVDYVRYCYGYDNPRNGTVFYDANDIRVGDVIIVGNSNGGGHWFICIDRDGNRLKVAEGNFNNKVRVGWNYTITGSKSIAGTSYSFTAGYHHLAPSAPPNPNPIPVEVLPGTYIIHSAHNDNYVWDIAGDSKEVNANIQLYQNVGNDVQKFEIIRRRDGYYTIRSVWSGMYLDTKTPVTNRSNVKLWDDWGAPETSWVFEDGGNGYVHIKTLAGNYYADTQGSEAKNHANIQVYQFADHNDQKWRLENVTPQRSTIKVAEGVYTIHSARNDNYVWDISGNSTENNANIQLYQDVGSTVEQFRIIDRGDYYVIQSVHSGMWLDIKLPAANNANVKLWDGYIGTESKWVFEDAGNGYVYIRSLTGYYVDLQGSEAKNGANVQVYQLFAGNNDQRWKLKEVGGPKFTVGLTDLTSGAATITGVAGGNRYKGVTDFTVSCDNACVVACTTDGGATYTRLAADGSGNTRSFTVDVTQNMTIVVALKGDLNLDGKVALADAAQAKRYCSKLRTLTAEQMLAADVVIDGEVKLADAAQIQRFCSGLRAFEW